MSDFLLNEGQTPQPRKKIGLTSVEAAALWLSDGATTDPELAQTYDSADLFDMDKLQQAAIRRQLGFDFRVKYTHRKFYIQSTEYPFVATQADYDGNLDEAAIESLVKGCLRLKDKWEAEKFRLDKAKKK
jgi:hypothetical protein